MNNKNSTQSEPQIIRLPETMKLSGKSKTSIYEDSSMGLFPKPVRIGNRSVGWVKGEVLDWIRLKMDERKEDVI